MKLPYAEVIGDPIAHSQSPLIHSHWLSALGIGGEYRRTRVQAGELRDFLTARRADPLWRGCNVTLPHKAAVAPLLDTLAPGAAAIGAVNCIVPRDGALVGSNSDIDGVAAALEGSEARHTVLIGGGGGARAALAWLAGQGTQSIAILLRDPGRGQMLGQLVGAETEVALRPFAAARESVNGATLVINASPLGMAGAPAMPNELIDAAAAAGAGATAFDMVYKPADTPFLQAARSGGARIVDGHAMLIGQARAAFAAFFGHSPPDGEEARLRAKLSGGS